jgi:hypothetical protein
MDRRVKPGDDTIIVTPGLDPGVHVATPIIFRFSMDRRVKPGDDETA